MAKNDNTKQLISEMKEMLNKSMKRKITLEGLVYGEDRGDVDLRLYAVGVQRAHVQQGAAGAAMADQMPQ